MNEMCNNPGLQNILVVVRNLLNLVMILVPIIAIISLAYTFISLMRDPDNKKTFPRVKNTLIACVIVFFIPIIVNTLMFILGESTSFSSCWINAKETPYTGLYYKNDSGKKKKGLLNDPKDYEKGIKKPTPTTNNNNVQYSNQSLNVEKYIETNNNNPKSDIGNGRNKYRAVQNATYTGKYVVYAQNRNYGSIAESSKGGRICWSDMKTKKMVSCVEVGADGGHMDGLAYDYDRGLVLKAANKKLLEYDNTTFKQKGYSNIDYTYVGMTYIPAIHMLVGESGGSFIFYKYNSGTNTYERDHTVQLQDFGNPDLQGMGTDGTNIFVIVSSPYNNIAYLSTYSITGQLLEKNTFNGSGYGSIGGTEIEAAFGDNDGHLYLAGTQGIGIVTNKTVNKIGIS